MSSLTKRLQLGVSLLLACLAAACGGGSYNPGNPPLPSAKFSNASLSGQYAFSMSGTELCLGQGSFFARVGTFFADGRGNITGGLEDVNICTPPPLTLQFTGGSYSIGGGGRGAPSFTKHSGNHKLQHCPFYEQPGFDHTDGRHGHGKWLLPEAEYRSVLESGDCRRLRL